MLKENMQNENYRKIHEELRKEVTDYVSSCLESVNLHNESGNALDYNSLSNFKFFSEHMIDVYKNKFKRLEEGTNDVGES